MTVKKYYYSLNEISNLLDLTIDDLMHYGITGQLGMCFDWASINSDIILNNLPLKLTFEYKGYPAHLWQNAVDDMLNSALTENPSERVFPLSIEQLSVINKHGFIKLKNGLDDCGQTLEIIKMDDGKHVEYPTLTINDIVVVSYWYEQFSKNFQLDIPDEPACIDIGTVFEDDDIPDNLYFAISLNKEVWPIPDNMNLPSKSELGELLLIKDPSLCKADLDAIIRLSTPNDIRLGGKRKNDKIDFVPTLCRKLI